MIRVDIRGLQDEQKRNMRAIRALKPSGEFGRVIRDATIFLHRYAVSITHVWTGSLRASHRMDVQGLRGRIYPDPKAINPKTKRSVVSYAGVEHARGGSHAYYGRTVGEAGPGLEPRFGHRFRFKF